MSHTYEHEGNELPSVTTILGEFSNKEALIQWAANSMKAYIIDHWESMQGCGIDECLNAARFDYKRLSKEALEIGSEVHNRIESYLRWGNYHYINGIGERTETKNCLSAFSLFDDDFEPEPNELEFSIYGNGWAGTLDFKGYLDGVPTILDWKTSKAIYPENPIQLAAYHKADGGWADQAGVVRLDKETGEYEMRLWKRKALKKYYRRFEKMVALYMELHPIIKKRSNYESI
jgi:hypothetical protein